MSDIQQGFLITAIGMGLVFVVIIFLWGLMALMMHLTSKTNKGEEVEPAELEAEITHVPETPFTNIQRQVAAAAVATALAMATSHPRHSEKADQDRSAALSPWQSFHRAQNLENKHTRG